MDASVLTAIDEAGRALGAEINAARAAGNVEKAILLSTAVGSLIAVHRVISQAAEFMKEIGEAVETVDEIAAAYKAATTNTNNA